MRAAEFCTLVQAPSTVKYRKEPPAPIKYDFSNERLQYCVDIAVLVERCDRSGYMAAFLSGMRPELGRDDMYFELAGNRTGVPDIIYFTND